MNRSLHAATVVLVASLGLFGCKSSDKGEATGASITKAADQIEKGIQELDTTVASLHALVDQPAADLNPQRKTFEKSLSALEGTAADVSETATAMRERGQAYFAQWDQQLASIQNEDIRERSTERRTAIEASLNKLQGDYTEAKTAFEPLLATLRDIRTALKADLTMNGIKALTPTVKEVDKEAGSVSKELRDLAQRFRELGVDLSRNNPTAVPVETEKK
jgi:chromosome segregation ATPase